MESGAASARMYKEMCYRAREKKRELFMREGNFHLPLVLSFGPFVPSLILASPG